MMQNICHLVEKKKKKRPIGSYKLPDFVNLSVFLFSWCSGLILASSQATTELLAHNPVPSRRGERTGRTKVKNLQGQDKDSLIGEKKKKGEANEIRKSLISSLQQTNAKPLSEQQSPQ